MTPRCVELAQMIGSVFEAVRVKLCFGLALLSECSQELSTRHSISQSQAQMLLLPTTRIGRLIVLNIK